MKQEYKRLLTDPRLVTVKHNGEDLHFWYHRRGALLAEKHGYTGDIESDVNVSEAEEFGVSVLRFLWICHLPFAPEMSFDEFDMMFLPSDYRMLGMASSEVVRLQLPKSDAGDEAEPKKTRGRAKKK